jgi:hypothetical protein
MQKFRKTFTQEFGSITITRTTITWEVLMAFYTTAGILILKYSKAQTVVVRAVHISYLTIRSFTCLEVGMTITNKYSKFQSKTS